MTTPFRGCAGPLLGGSSPFGGALGALESGGKGWSYVRQVSDAGEARRDRYSYLSERRLGSLRAH